MDETIDKRKVMTPARKEHMKKMREALARKKELEKETSLKSEKAEPKKKTREKVAKKIEPEVDQQTEIEEQEEQEESDSEEDTVQEEIKPVIKKPSKKQQPAKKVINKTKDDEIYELGKRVYKENKKKALFEEVRQFILQEFQSTPDSEDEYEPVQTQRRSQQPAPINNLMSIF